MSEMLQLGTNLREARDIPRTHPGVRSEPPWGNRGHRSSPWKRVSERSVLRNWSGWPASTDAPVPFLCGSELMQVPETLAAAPGWDTLPDQDRAEVLRFAYFLQHTRTAPHPSLLQGERA